MFSHTIKSYETQDQHDRLISALNCVCMTRPYLSGLVTLLKIYVSEAMASAGITSSGRLLINPHFMERLKLQELAFIIAHELMHLVLQTRERQGNFPNHQLVNIAHDFIINDDLLKDFAFDPSPLVTARPPAGGLFWPDHHFPDWKPAKEYSLEEMVTTLRKQNINPKQAWNDVSGPASSEDGGDQRGNDAPPGGASSLHNRPGLFGFNWPKPQEEAPGTTPPPSQPSAANSPASKEPLIQNPWDVLSPEEERRIFPELPQEAVTAEQKAIHESVVRSYSEAALGETLKKIEQGWGRGTQSGHRLNTIEMLRDTYVTPWEAAIQRWFDSAVPGTRSFARASRRGVQRSNIVLPGRKREGWTLHIVLDTSGSMSNSLRYALGAIDQFCQNNNVGMIHILQCDTQVTVDQWIETGSLGSFQAKGFGGSDLTPAMMSLAEDPEVKAVLVLTDGHIRYPENEPPYETLWGIVNRGSTNFKYGTAIRIDVNNN